MAGPEFAPPAAGVLAAQGDAATSHGNQRLSIQRTSASRAASPSADNRFAFTASPRSVHACGSVIDP